MRGIRITGFVVAVAFLAAGGRPAHSAMRCDESGFHAFRRSVTRSLSCSRQRMRGMTEPCTLTPPPPCAAAAYRAFAELTHVDRWSPRGPRAHAECQYALARSAARFLLRRVNERSRGERRELARLSVGRLVSQCRVDAVEDGAGGVLPVLGGPCSPVVAAPGEAFDPLRATQCMQPVLERIATEGEPLLPNIVLIVTDDQRWDTLGYMPRVRRDLVGRGIEFANGFVTTPLCCPSRASFLTGRYAHHTGIRGNGPPAGGASLFDASSTIATWLHDAGYRSALLGKYMNGNYLLAPAVPPGWDLWRTFVEDSPLYYGYTLNEDGRLRPYGTASFEYSTDVLGAMAVRFIRDNADRPFFLLYAPAAPHSPFTPAPRHAGVHSALAPFRPPSWHEPDVSDKPPSVRFWARPQGAGGLESSDEVRRSQLDTLLAVDDAVGEILETLDKLGLTDDTVVLFTSDNGYLWGEHWLTGKEWVYEESIRVPFVLRYPVRYPVPATRDELVLNIDVAPTFADAAGVFIPTEVDGSSLLGLLDERREWRRDFLLEHVRNFIVPGYGAVRSERWKYARHDLASASEELYDLDADPYEMENLAHDPAYAGVVYTLSARLDELLAQ